MGSIRDAHDALGFKVTSGGLLGDPQIDILGHVIASFWVSLGVHCGIVATCYPGVSPAKFVRVAICHPSDSVG